jgi:hypothetical protein
MTDATPAEQDDAALGFAESVIAPSRIRAQGEQIRQRQTAQSKFQKITAQHFLPPERS